MASELLGILEGRGEKRPLSPRWERPVAKRLERGCVEDDGLSFSLDSQNSSPQRTCTLSPNFLDDVADELELAPLLLQHPDLDTSLPPISVPPFSRDSTMSTPEIVHPVAKDAGAPPLSLLEAVQPAYMSSRRSFSDLQSIKPHAERPSSPEASMLQSHSAWQKKLRAALSDSDAATRALLSSATGRDLYGTVQVLARLSPRQIDSLHPPARELVTSLLKQTREQVCQEAGLAPAGMWEMASRLLGQHSLTEAGVLGPCI
ncbi:hypothetical protein AB1Y20_017358 [Prymnesium parvum]|uniref:Uncharacterized protein n=1 Tax=Prymnesium parvum TaxID=97485 RepID=A0AB34JNR4_PRYPA